jgi:hypothetical protein
VNNSISGGDASVTTIFFARWKGRIRIAKAGEYAFHLAANDAGRLFIDGGKVVESIKPNVAGNSALPDAEGTGAVSLNAGDHELLLEYYNSTGRDGLRLAWSFESVKNEVIPSEVLFHETGSRAIAVMTDARDAQFPSRNPAATRSARTCRGLAAYENDRWLRWNGQTTTPDFTLALQTGPLEDLRRARPRRGWCPRVFRPTTGVVVRHGSWRLALRRAFSSPPIEDGLPRENVQCAQSDDGEF